MDRDEGVFVDGTPYVTAGDVIANLHGRVEIPLLLAVEGGNSDTTGDVNGLGVFGNGLERTLNTIEDTVKKARTELDRQGLSGSGNGVADRDTGYDSYQNLYLAWEGDSPYRFPRRPEWLLGRH